MEKPHKYAIFEKTKQGSKLINETDTYCYWFNQGKYTTLIDTRYESKLRLYRYWQRINGIIEPKYEPFKGTEIGKTEPILNF